MKDVRSLLVKVDATGPLITGMPPAPCEIWPPNNKLVKVASVTAADPASGVAPDSLKISVLSNEAVSPSDIVIKGGTVAVRASRSPSGQGRTYTITSQVLDLAGNVTTATAACVVPRDRRH